MKSRTISAFHSAFLILLFFLKLGLAQSAEFVTDQMQKANTPTDAEIKTMLRDNIEIDKECVGLAVGVVDEHGARIVCHGKLDNGTGLDVDGDTLFEIGSITKVFTALLLQDMVERGEMKLDDPVQKYLPSSVRMPTWQNKEITLLHLATHTSGLPRDSEGELYGFLSRCTLHQPPGVRSEYSNLGMGLLGHAIALKAGKDIETLLVERICQPLGMESTRFSLSPELIPRLAIGHGMPGHRVRSFGSLRQETDPRVPSLLGAGSLHSTANDMLKFVCAYAELNPSPLSSLIQKAQALHSLESGNQKRLAWNVDAPIFEHGGLTDGFEAELAFDVKKRCGIVVLSSCANYSTIIPAIWRPLLKGRSPRPVNVVSLPAALYDRYVGNYEDEKHLIWTIRHLSERLLLQCTGHGQTFRAPSVELFPVSDTVWRNDFYEGKATFHLPANGRDLKVALAFPDQTFELTWISTDVPKPPDPVQLESKVYDSYVGQYRRKLFGLFGVGPKLSISNKADEMGNHLIVRAYGLPGYDSAEFFPLSKTFFVVTPTVSDDVRLTFLPNHQGKTKGVNVDWNGKRLHGTRISCEATN